MVLHMAVAWLEEVQFRCKAHTCILQMLLLLLVMVHQLIPPVMHHIVAMATDLVYHLVTNHTTNIVGWSYAVWKTHCQQERSRIERPMWLMVFIRLVNINIIPVNYHTGASNSCTRVSPQLASEVILWCHQFNWAAHTSEKIVDMLGGTLISQAAKPFLYTMKHFVRSFGIVQWSENVNGWWSRHLFTRRNKSWMIDLWSNEISIIIVLTMILLDLLDGYSYRSLQLERYIWVYAYWVLQHEWMKLESQFYVFFPLSLNKFVFLIQCYYHDRKIAEDGRILLKCSYYEFKSVLLL